MPEPANVTVELVATDWSGPAFATGRLQALTEKVADSADSAEVTGPPGSSAPTETWARTRGPLEVVRVMDGTCMTGAAELVGPKDGTLAASRLIVQAQVMDSVGQPSGFAEIGAVKVRSEPRHACVVGVRTGVPTVGAVAITPTLTVSVVLAPRESVTVTWNTRSCG